MSQPTSARVSQEELTELFKKALWEVDRKKIDKLDFNSRFAELGMDSVLMFEVVGYLEQRLGILLPDEQLTEINSIKDLYELINNLPPQQKRL